MKKLLLNWLARFWDGALFFSFFISIACLFVFWMVRVNEELRDDMERRQTDFLISAKNLKFENTKISKVKDNQILTTEFINSTGHWISHPSFKISFYDKNGSFLGNIYVNRPDNIEPESKMELFHNLSNDKEFIFTDIHDVRVEILSAGTRKTKKTK